MKFDFKKIVNRENTRAAKWEMRNRLFGTNDVLPMWVADMDFETVPEIKEKIISRAQHNLYGYTTYDNDILTSITSWIKKQQDVEVNPNLISFSPGVIPSLHALVQAFTNEGDQIVIQTPVYPPFFSVVKAHGREIVENPLIFQNGRYEMNLDELEEQFKNGVKAMILCSPHNPIGRVWSYDELETLAKLSAKYNVYIFSDEIHADIVFRESKHFSLATINKESEPLIFTLMAPSKTFNIAGLQASYTISPNKDAKKQFDQQLMKQGFSSLNTFGFTAMEAAYNYGEKWLKELLTELEENRNIVIEKFNYSHTGIQAVKSEGTYLIWLDFSNTGLEHDEIKEKLVKEAKVGLNDGKTFGSNGEKFMRMNIACPKETLNEGLNRIIKAFKKES